MALRVGAESKPKLYGAIGLGLVVLLLAVRLIVSSFSTPSPSPAPASVASRPVPVVSNTVATARPPAGAPTDQPYAHEAVHLPSASALDPTLHPEVMAQAEATTYTGNGRNIFSANSVAPPPAKIEKPQAFRPSAPTGPPQPPPPPAIDLKFYGYASASSAASAQSNQRQAFLLHGDDIFLAHEGDVVDRRYRVVSIHPMSVEVEDIPYHNTQSLPLTQN